METVSHITIGARSKHEVAFDCPDTRTRFTWTFETEAHDIEFSVTFVSADDETTATVVEAVRMPSHEVPQCGTYETSEAGTLRLQWSNEYSKLRSKALTFTVARDDNVPEDTTAEQRIVDTLYGPGTMLELRPDQVAVVDLGFGRAFLQGVAITDEYAGPTAPKSRIELQRARLVRYQVLIQHKAGPDVLSWLCVETVLRYVTSWRYPVHCNHPEQVPAAVTMGCRHGNNQCFAIY